MFPTGQYECGIYAIINKLSSKIYIGSTVLFERRFANHRAGLRNNTHPNEHLQRAWIKYGEENFEFIKILICEEKDLLFYEQKFMDHYQSYNPEKGYNILEIAGSARGFKHSQESKDKISRANKGKRMPQESIDRMAAKKRGVKLSEEHKAKIGESNKGKIVSEETKIKIGIGNSGKSPSEEVRKKMSLARIGKSPANKGIPLSEERKQHLREVNLGKTHSEASKEKNRIASTGRYHTEETKLKMSEKQKGKKMSPEHIEKLRLINTGKKLSKESIEKREATKRENKEKQKLEGYIKPKQTWTEEARKKIMEGRAEKKRIKGEAIMFEAQEVLQNTTFNI